jgi:hypothetical protein
MTTAPASLPVPAINNAFQSTFCNCTNQSIAAGFLVFAWPTIVERSRLFEDF